MRGSKLISQFYYGEHGMFLTPGRWMALHRMAEGFVARGGVPRADLDFGDEAAEPAAWKPYSVDGGVAVVPLAGVIAKRVGMMDALCGGFADLAVFDLAMKQAAADPEVRAIVVAVDSPGGYGLGLQESASLIREIDAGGVPVYAYTDTEMCSAAYWIGAAAREVGVSESAYVGSVGSYMFVFDETEAMEKAGVKVEAFVQGRFKAAGHPLQPLSEEQRGWIKGQLEEHAQAFRDSVMGDRPRVVREDVEGQHFPGAEAVERGFADYVVRSLEEFVDGVRAAHVAG